MSTLHYKDEILNNLAEKGNIAQFISYDNELNQRYLRINSIEPNFKFESIWAAIAGLIARSSEGRVNVRSFKPEQPKSFPFEYGKTTVAEVISILERNAADGLYSIVNETISVDDGGVSGVALGNVIEFTPNDTPRGVEKCGACRLPRFVGLEILEKVYGFYPKLPYAHNVRVEFSIHPMRRGINKSNTIIWELEEFRDFKDDVDIPIEINFPNNFSKLIGDKVYGLLVADAFGFKVPRTRVIPRLIAPFHFGNHTGVAETWIRTSPAERTSGKFSTFKGWVDPYALLQKEDPENNKIASVLSQQAVDAIYSGSLITDVNQKPIIEGVKGSGDSFMLGIAESESLPHGLLDHIYTQWEKLHKILGAIEMEWVADNDLVWIVQLHKSKNCLSFGSTIVGGEPESWVDFQTAQGLDKLQELINSSESNVGINLIGNIGITSHLGDVLRKANKISKITRIKNTHNEAENILSATH